MVEAKPLFDLFSKLPDSYDTEVSPWNRDPVGFSIPKADDQRARQTLRGYIELLDDNPTLAGTVALAQRYLSELPGGLDFAHQVNADGSIRPTPVKAVFSDWVKAWGPNHVRLSQSRTASENFLALRAPVMGGLAIERTLYPRIAHDPTTVRTLFVLQDPIAGSAIDRWRRSAPARVFNLAVVEMDNQLPYTIGPLYDGHPNEVKTDVEIEVIRAFTSAVIKRLIDK